MGVPKWNKIIYPAVELVDLCRLNPGNSSMLTPRRKSRQNEFDNVYKKNEHDDRIFVSIENDHFRLNIKFANMN